MNATSNVATRLDPEAFRTPLPSVQPVDEFAVLRTRIEELETQSKAGDRDAASAPGGVTAAVTDAPKPQRQRRKAQAITQANERNTMNAQTATAQAQPAQSNTPTFNDLLQTAITLGEQAGQGKDTQIRFDLKVLEGAYLGVIDLDPNKHGNDRRDGIVLAEAYAKAQNTAVIFDAKAPNQRKLISNVDKMIKLGANPKWGQGEPLATVNALVTMRQTLRKDPAHAKKLDDAHNMLMRFATAQLKEATLFTGDDLKTFAFKKDPNLREAADILEGVRKMMNNLKVGKVSNCPDLDNSPEVQTIINACTKRLTAIAKAKGAQSGPNASQAGGTV